MLIIINIDLEAKYALECNKKPFIFLDDKKEMLGSFQCFFMKSVNMIVYTRETRIFVNHTRICASNLFILFLARLNERLDS